MLSTFHVLNLLFVLGYTSSFHDQIKVNFNGIFYFIPLIVLFCIVPLLCIGVCMPYTLFKQLCGALQLGKIELTLLLVIWSKDVQGFSIRGLGPTRCPQTSKETSWYEGIWNAKVSFLYLGNHEKTHTCTHTHTHTHTHTCTYIYIYIITKD